MLPACFHDNALAWSVPACHEYFLALMTVHAVGVRNVVITLLCVFGINCVDWQLLG